MCFFGKNLLIGVPEIAKGMTSAIGFWDLVPQALAGFRAVITEHKGYNLAGSSAQGSPEPVFCRFDEDKRPDFVQFKDIGVLGRQQALLDRRLLGYFFLSMAVKVLREM